MDRDNGFRREMRHKAISRKKAICKQVYGNDWYKHDGQYDKGKIHCGCGLCKWGKKYGYPTLRTERELEYFETCIRDCEENGQ